MALGHEKRWALIAVIDGDRFLLGRYSWPDASRDEPQIRTFRTRQKAREAKKQLRSFRSNARVVRVETTVQTY